MAKKTPRPARTLLVFGLRHRCGSTGCGPGRGAGSRELGLDLEGGTRITLSAIEKGGAVTPTKLKQAASIVDQRVNGSGVSEAEVSTSGQPQHHRRDPRQERLQPRRGSPARPRSCGSASSRARPSPAPRRRVSRPLPRPRPALRRRPVLQGRRPRRPQGQPGDSQAASGAVRRPHPHARGALGLGADPAGHAAPGHRQGCAGRQAAPVVPGPGRGVADEVRQVHLPEGQ